MGAAEQRSPGGPIEPADAATATGPRSAADDADSNSRAGTVEVVYALPQRQRVVSLPLPTAGLTAGEALQRSGLLDEFPEIARHALVLGIYGEVCDPTRALTDGDRVEIYRPLANDPRASRRGRVAGGRREKSRRR